MHLLSPWEHLIMFAALPAPLRAIMTRYNSFLGGYQEMLCYTVTTPLRLDEALQRMGVRAGDLQPKAEHDLLDHDGCIFIDQVGDAVVTWDWQSVAGIYLRTDEALRRGVTRAVAQWDSYNLDFSFSPPTGPGFGWSEAYLFESDDAVASIREAATPFEGPYACHRPLFAPYLREVLDHLDDDDGEADPAYLVAAILTSFELETRIRLDEELLRSLRYAIHVPPHLRH
ncbi:hypothetical protein [Nonomuraea wenchangensis]|uniref:hypothetical protein n=1 Tax=Nonomuraea wenchangensis TaxID=568860 RepID=UPI0034357775